MNSHYQLFLNADANTQRQMSTTSGTSTKTSAADEIDSIDSPDTKTQVSSISDSPTYTDPIKTPTKTLYSEPVKTYIGDASIKDGTTINIFNPDGQTSTTSLSDQVTVDGETGETETGTGTEFFEFKFRC